MLGDPDLKWVASSLFLGEGGRFPKTTCTQKGHAATNGAEEFTTLANAQSGCLAVKLLRNWFPQAIMRVAHPLVIAQVPPQLGMQPAFLLSVKVPRQGTL